MPRNVAPAPLYLLPLFAPLALFAGRSIAVAASGTWRATLRTRRAGLALCALWLLVGAIKLTAARRVEHRDGRRLAAWVAHEIAGRTDGAAVEIWAIDADVHALPFYGLPVPRSATMRPDPYPMYQPYPPLVDALAAERPAAPILIAPRTRLAGVRAVAEARGYRCSDGEPDLRLGLLDCRRIVPNAARPPRSRKEGRDRTDRNQAPRAAPEATPRTPVQIAAARIQQCGGTCACSWWKTSAGSPSASRGGLREEGFAVDLAADRARRATWRSRTPTIS